MIPFNKPVHLGTETARINEAILRNGHLAGSGPFGRECERLLAERLGRRTLVVSSCTHPLFYNMTDRELDEVVTRILEFLRGL